MSAPTNPSPLVSVIIPVYNGQPFLNAAIDSVLAQTYSSYEVIVIDDGSTDRTSEIAQSYPSVRYFFQPRAGTGSARNLGIRHARGEFLAFLDADDLWLPEKLALQMAAFEADPDLEVVSGLVEQFIDPGHHRQYSIPAEPQPGYSAIALLIKQTAMAAVGHFPESADTAEMISWFLQIPDAKRRLLILPQVVARRRIHGGNKSLQNREEKTHNMLLELKRFIEKKRAASDPGDRS